MSLFLTHGKHSRTTRCDSSYDSMALGILGRVTHYITRYEVQGRGSLLAHMMLWIHPSNVDQFCSEITAHKPGK